MYVIYDFVTTRPSILPNRNAAIAIIQGSIGVIGRKKPTDWEDLIWTEEASKLKQKILNTEDSYKRRNEYIHINLKLKGIDNNASSNEASTSSSSFSSSTSSMDTSEVLSGKRSRYDIDSSDEVLSGKKSRYDIDSSRLPSNFFDDVLTSSIHTSLPGKAKPYTYEEEEYMSLTDEQGREYTVFEDEDIFTLTYNNRQAFYVKQSYKYRYDPDEQMDKGIIKVNDKPFLSSNSIEMATRLMDAIDNSTNA
jgi:hypothetical protein